MARRQAATMHLMFILALLGVQTCALSLEGDGLRELDEYAPAARGGSASDDAQVETHGAVDGTGLQCICRPHDVTADECSDSWMQHPHAFTPQPQGLLGKCCKYGHKHKHKHSAKYTDVKKTELCETDVRPVAANGPQCCQVDGQGVAGGRFFLVEVVRRRREVTVEEETGKGGYLDNILNYFGNHIRIKTGPYKVSEKDLTGTVWIDGTTVSKENVSSKLPEALGKGPLCDNLVDCPKEDQTKEIEVNKLEGEPREDVALVNQVPYDFVQLTLEIKDFHPEKGSRIYQRTLEGAITGAVCEQVWSAARKDGVTDTCENDAKIHAFKDPTRGSEESWAWEVRISLPDDNERRAAINVDVNELKIGTAIGTWNTGQPDHLKNNVLNNGKDPQVSLTVEFQCGQDCEIKAEALKGANKKNEEELIKAIKQKEQEEAALKKEVEQNEQALRAIEAKAIQRQEHEERMQRIEQEQMKAIEKKRQEEQMKAIEKKRQEEQMKAIEKKRQEEAALKKKRGVENEPRQVRNWRDGESFAKQAAMLMDQAYNGYYDRYRRAVPRHTFSDCQDRHQEGQFAALGGRDLCKRNECREQAQKCGDEEPKCQKGCAYVANCCKKKIDFYQQ